MTNYEHASSFGCVLLGIASPDRRPAGPGPPSPAIHGLDQGPIATVYTVAMLGQLVQPTWTVGSGTGFRQCPIRRCIWSMHPRASTHRVRARG